MGRFIKFDTLVRDICSGMGDDSARRYQPVARQLRRTLEMMNLYVYQTYESKEFEIGENLTVAMPTETIEVQKVGIVENGQLVIMGYNDRIRRPEESCTCGGQSTTTTSTTSTDGFCPICTFQNVYWNGGMLPEVYGVRPDRFPNGEYRWDRNRNLLEFGSGRDISAGSKVWVEYKLPLGTDDLQSIPSEMYFTLLFYVQYILLGATDPGRSNYAMTEFRRHYHQLKTFYQRRNLEDYCAALVSGFTSTTKK